MTRAALTRLRRLRDEGGDRGTAIIEFCFLAVLLLVPLTYVILTVFRLQSAAYAVSSASREAGRIFVTSESGSAEGRARAAADLAMADHGYQLAANALDVRCAGRTECLEPGTFVRVRVSHRVPLPLVPAFFDAVVPTSVRVSSEHLEYVDRFRAGR
jgi:Flp pilus assembly protein TadG